MVMLLEFRNAVRLCVALCALGVGVGAAQAQTSRQPAQAPAAPVPAAKVPQSPATTQASLEVNGFRSAKFGMTEAEVRAAIAKDFKVSGEAIQTGENSAERTKVLSIQAADVLPDGGKANVSYIFGYTSKKLIQVAIAWSAGSDASLGPDRLLANGNILRNHFQAAGYKADTIASNAVVDGGILMFRGDDSAGHTTLLLLQGTTANGENAQRVLTPTALVLFYLADAQKPDVFKLEPGQF